MIVRERAQRHLSRSPICLEKIASHCSTSGVPLNGCSRREPHVCCDQTGAESRNGLATVYRCHGRSPGMARRRGGVAVSSPQAAYWFGGSFEGAITSRRNESNV